MAQTKGTTMKAIYKGKLYTMEDDNGHDIKLRSEHHEIKWVSYETPEPELIIDPTDDQIKNILTDDEGHSEFPDPYWHWSNLELCFQSKEAWRKHLIAHGMEPTLHENK
jgi:hypothetical protein